MKPLKPKYGAKLFLSWNVLSSIDSDVRMSFDGFVVKNFYQVFQWWNALCCVKPKFVQVRVCVCIFFCLLVTLSAAQTCSNVILSSTFLAQDFDVMWIEFSLWPNGCCAESDGFIFIWHFSNFGLVFMSWVYVDLVAANSLFRK